MTFVRVLGYHCVGCTAPPGSRYGLYFRGLDYEPSPGADGPNCAIPMGEMYHSTPQTMGFLFVYRDRGIQFFVLTAASSSVSCENRGRLEEHMFSYRLQRSLPPRHERISTYVYLVEHRSRRSQGKMEGGGASKSGATTNCLHVHVGNQIIGRKSPVASLQYQGQD